MPKLKDKREIEKDLDRIIQQNQRVDPDQLQDVRLLIAELRKRGHRGPTYDLVPPYERRLLHEDEGKLTKSERIR